MPYYANWHRLKSYWGTAETITRSSFMTRNRPRITFDLRGQRRAAATVSGLHRADFRRRDGTGEEGHTGFRTVWQADHPRSGRLLCSIDPRSRGRRSHRACEINAKGIRTQDGRKINLDVIIYATGYHLDFLSTIDIRGRDGKTLGKDRGDNPRAYRGGTVPGFPNLFTMSAPNYSPGHGAGANFSMEVLAHYMIECLQLIALRGATTMEVTSVPMRTTSLGSTTR